MGSGGGGLGRWGSGCGPPSRSSPAIPQPSPRCRRLSFAASFHTKYVATNTTPPPDFMRTEPGYDAFLNHTLRLARGVQRVALIAPADVQRSPLNGNLFNAVPY